MKTELRVPPVPEEGRGALSPMFEQRKLGGSESWGPGDLVVRKEETGVGSQISREEGQWA